MSTAFHPETDGQTERMNRIVEEVLRAYVGHTQTDWAKWLPVVQFAINNSWQESVRNTPFFLNHGRHPRLPTLVEMPEVKLPAAESFATTMRTHLDLAKRALQAAQARMVNYAGKQRRDTSYQIGDWVLLSTKNLRPASGVKTLMPKYVGPFKVTALRGPVAVQLHLTDGYERLHPVFHVSLLKPYKARDTPDKLPVVTPLPITFDEDVPVFEVEAILNHQSKPLKTERHTTEDTNLRVTAYYLKWKGRDADHNSWEPAQAVTECDDLLSQYWLALGKCIVQRKREFDLVGPCP